MLRKCKTKTNLNKQTIQFFLTMYSRLEIIEIFKNVNCWDELERVSKILYELMQEETKVEKQISLKSFLNQVSQYTFRRLEKL